jgi:hypothetical protein
VVGKAASDRYELVYLPDLEIFTSPTSAPSYFIREYQENDPNGVKNEARMSGFEYLRFYRFHMFWMHEPEEYITLRAAKVQIEAQMEPAQQAIRQSEDLYASHYPYEFVDAGDETLLDTAQWQNVQDPALVKTEYPYDSYPSSELASQCNSYLEFPTHLKEHFDYSGFAQTQDIQEGQITGETVQMSNFEPTESMSEEQAAEYARLLVNSLPSEEDLLRTPENLQEILELTEEQIEALVGSTSWEFDFENQAEVC